MKVTIIEYSPAWPKLFEQEKILLQNMLEETGAIIEHIGSTSVVRLAAKPIIDIMIGLPDFAIANKLVPKFIARGYNYISKYEDVMPERRFFIKKSHETNTHHIHMVQIGSEFWERHLLFRDFLRNNPDIAQAYASLKIDLAKCEWQDGNEYAEAKTEFIRNIEDQARKQSGSIGR